MIDFFVEQLLGGFLLVAFPIAVLAGLISFISPCVLPLVPGYLSFAAGYSKSKGRVFLGSILFVLGFSVLFISYGALFGGIGSRIASVHLCSASYLELAGRLASGPHLQLCRLWHFKNQVQRAVQFSPSAIASDLVHHLSHQDFI